jgi:hypothetical protein
MKEYFIAGMICLLNPVSDMPQCFNFHEDPINYYNLEDCKAFSTQKANEMADNFTANGFQILELRIACLVDKQHKNT